MIAALMLSGGGGGQPVGGPASSTDNAVVRWNGTGGNSLQNSAVFIDDSGNVQIAAAPNATPDAHTLTIGESSVPSVDTNVSGGSGTVSSGNGTGNAIVSDLQFQTPAPVASGSGAQTMATRFTLRYDGATFDVPVISNAPVRTGVYTVATLPTGAQGDRAMVTDATAPSFLGALTGGGAVVTPVFHNGTAWRAG